MWMETILLRGTIESLIQANLELEELLETLDNKEGSLESLDIFQRHPEFGDFLVEIRWNSDEPPHVTRLCGAISRLLEQHGPIQRSMWMFKSSLSFRVSDSTQNSGENK